MIHLVPMTMEHKWLLSGHSDNCICMADQLLRANRKLCGPAKFVEYLSDHFHSCSKRWQAMDKVTPLGGFFLPFNRLDILPSSYLIMDAQICVYGAQLNKVLHSTIRHVKSTDNGYHLFIFFKKKLWQAIVQLQFGWCFICHVPYRLECNRTSSSTS